MSYFPVDRDRMITDDSEFGVERGGGEGWDNSKPSHQERLARMGIPPSEGGPYRALSPGEGRRAGRQHRQYGGKRLAR